MHVPSTTIVDFPYLFVGFLDKTPDSNIHYLAAKAASEDVIMRYFKTSLAST